MVEYSEKSELPNGPIASRPVSKGARQARKRTDKPSLHPVNVMHSSQIKAENGVLLYNGNRIQSSKR